MKLKCSEFGKSYNAESQKKIILDVRNPDETSAGVLPGAVVIPLPQLEQRANELSPDLHIYIHCRSGKRAQVAYDLLKAKGYTHLFCGVEGGYDDLVGTCS